MKNLTYVCAALLCTSLITFTGCSDDDDDKDKTAEYAAAISKTYTGSDLTMTLNGPALSGQSAGFKTTDLKTGEVTLPNLIPGEAEIVVSGVTLTKTGTRAAAGNEIYSLSGTASNANRNITLSGTVGNGLSLDVTFKVTSAIANTWKPAAVPFTFAITAGAEAMINMHGLFGQEVIPLSYLPSMIEPLGSSVFAGMVDFKLQMKDNGNLIAKWAPIGEYPMFEAGESQEGMVTYNVVDNQVYVQIALVDLITNLVASGGLSTDLLGSLGMSITDLINLATSFSQALPINIEVTGSSLKATVTKAMMLPYLDNLIPLLQGLVGTIEIPEAIATEMGITGPALAGFLGEVKTAIEESSQFDLVINLVPAS